MDSLLAGVLAEKSEHQEAYNEEEDTSRSITKYVDKKPVWEDEDDNTAVVNITAVSRLKKLRTAADETVIPASEYAARLRAQHKKLNPGTTWAELPWQRKKRKIRGGDDFGLALGLENEDEDEEEDLSYEGDGDVGALLENKELAVKSKGRLPQGLIEVTRMKDANVVEPSDAVIQSVEFHRNAQLLLTAGFDKKIRFFQVCLLLSFALATECY